MRSARERKSPVAMRSQLYSDKLDTFAEAIKRMLERGVVAHTSSNALKAQIVKLIRDYSYEIPYAQDKISQLFLELCDLMVCGELSRMEGDTFKLYLAMTAYPSGSFSIQATDITRLMELTGILDSALVYKGIAELQAQGYIDPTEDSSSIRKRPPAKRRETPIGSTFMVP